MESSGDEQSPCTENTHSTSSTSSTLPGVGALSDVATQQAINLQILSQLSSINDRLNNLEKKDAKKDSDPKKKKSSSKTKISPQMAPVTLPPKQHATLNMPNVSNIRNDVLIQSQVDQRLKYLTNLDSTGTKIKSLRGVLLKWWSQIGSNGHKSLSFRVLKKKEFNMTSYRSCSGWLVIVAS